MAYILLDGSSRYKVITMHGAILFATLFAVRVPPFSAILVPPLLKHLLSRPQVLNFQDSISSIQPLVYPLDRVRIVVPIH